MKSSLTSNVEKDLAETIKREWSGSVHLRQRLVEMLEKDIEGIHQSMRNEDFNEDNWANIHARKLGEAKGLTKLITLLK